MSEIINNGSPEASLYALPASVNIHFNFSPHGFKEDFKDLPELFNDCDVYIPELPGWNANILKTYQKVAKGNKKAFQDESHRLSTFSDPEAKLLELGLIFGSRKPIVFIDVRSDEQLHGRLVQELIYQHYLAKTDAERLDSMKKLGQVQAEREDVMVKRLGENLGRFLESHPRFTSGDKTPHALVNLGPLHTNVYNRVASVLNDENTCRVTKQFFEKPVLFPFSTIVFRRYIFDMPVDNGTLMDDVSRLATYREVVESEDDEINRTAGA